MRKPGDQISRYIVESVLGSGGMGDVYEALDTRLERKVALKLVRSEGKQAHAQRLLREARAIAAFEHPNAVVIYDVGETEGEMFIAMELVRGRPLRHFIGDASIPLGRKLRWLVDAARALGAAHRAGLIHRDVKPDNIMVRNDGVVKVLDFGIARLASGNAQKNALGDSATVTAEGTLIGTPRYLAPEQLRGEDLDGRTDEFAWAVTAYELLTGEAPFSGETSVALLSKILTSTPKSLALPDAPPALEQALFRAMAKRPEERFESIDDAADALEAFADAPTDRNRIPKESPSLPGLSPANTAPDPSSKVCCDPETSRPSPSKLGSSGTGKSQKRIIWLGAGAALLALGAGTFYATRPSKPLQSQATASEIAPAALIVSSLGCEASVIEGGQPVADLDRVIGYAACGRLAIELGVSFGREKPSHKLSVRTRLSDSGAELTLGIGDKTATAKAKTPLEAIVEAIPKLTSQLAPAPLAPEEIARWGAKDAEGARRIRKTWLRMILDYETDDQAAVRELLRTDPDSARTHMLALVAELGTAENQKTHAARVRELLEKLPPAQANYMRNALHNRGFPDPSNPSPKEPVSIRKAFTEDPQDTVLMTMLAIDSLRNNAKEEGYALQDRLWKQSPAEAAWSMHFMCTWTPERRDFEREAKYLELAWQHIPEVLTWDLAISHYFHTNQLPKARHSIQLGLQLGLASGVSGSFYFDTGRAWLELATWSPKEAREIANWMMGIPRPMVATWGANVLAASYFFEGRIIDGMNLMARRLDAEDEANAKNNKLGVRIASDLTQRLWLPLPLPSKERLERMRFLAMTDEGHGISELNNLYMELLRMHHDPKHPKQKAEQYLKDVEAHITAMPDLAPEKRAQFTLWTLPAIRRLKGNEEAVKLWHASQTAPFASRRAMALEAGLAFLGVAKVEEAEAALKLAENPHQIEMQSLSAIIARIRRGALYRSQNRIAEAEALEKQIGELWINADPGMRAYFEKLK